MSAPLNRKIFKRKALRQQFSKVLSEAKTYLGEEEITEEKIISLEASLRSKKEEISKLDEEIEELIEVEKVEEEVLESLEFFEPSLEIIASLGVRLGKLRMNSSHLETSSVATASSSTKVHCKLRKLELKPFSGDPLEYQGFMDQFEVSVNSHEGLSDIDKFNYLLSFLKDKALAVVKGLSLSSENYKQALRLLQERFGNPQLLISAHLDKLIKISGVKSINNVEGLRKLYNEVETSVRNLRALEVETKTFGCLLIPMLKNKLPDEMLLVISRGFGGNVWTLEEFMEFFNRELQAKESFFSPHSKGGDTSRELRKFSTAENLHVGSTRANEKYNRRKCAFCSGKHPSSHCEKFNDVNERVVLVKRFKLCFLCLSDQHVVNKCQSKYSCNKCGGRHHISLCFKDSNNPSLSSGQPPPSLSHVTHIGVSNGILLQTAMSKVSSATGSFYDARILFDSGSQRSYVSEELRKRLKLKSVRKERIVLKVFGQSEHRAQSLDIVQLFVKGESDETFCIEALVVPLICSPLSNQNISFAAREFPSLRSLKLADSKASFLSSKVDILVGLDFYNNFFSGKVVRTSGGPTAHETVFGWVLSGPFSSESSNFSSSSNLCTVSHVLRCSIEAADSTDNALRTDLERFWQVEGVKESNDVCVIH